MTHHPHTTPHSKSIRLWGSKNGDTWVLSLILTLFLSGFFLIPWEQLFTTSVADRIMTAAPDYSKMWRENFATYFISITLEAAPYMILGAFLAALIETFLPPEIIPRLVKRFGFWGIPMVALLAPIFPICECGVVIIARRLFRKGLPLPHTLTYLLAAPIINPIVLFGTWIAFYQNITYPIMRGLGGFLVAVTIGLLFYRFSVRKALTDDAAREHLPAANPISIPIVESNASKPDENSGKRGIWNRIHQILFHVREDFLAMGIYFLFGVFIASCMKTFVPAEQLFELGAGTFTGPGVMMVAAFVLSLCSEADAFLAASFIEFDMFAHMAFLVYGPMLDIKLLLMYRVLFRPKFIGLFALAVTVGVALYITGLRLFMGALL
ncbi:MAG: permease [Magnetococcales bacterium]|nr:permease [Magnetococcales bacterium]